MVETGTGRDRHRRVRERRCVRVPLLHASGDADGGSGLGGRHCVADDDVDRRASYKNGVVHPAQGGQRRFPAFDAAKEFSAGKVDLAIIRADVGDLAEVRTVVLMAHGVVMLLAPPGSAIDSIDALKGTTIGVVGGEANRPIVNVLRQEYDLDKHKVVFKDITAADVPQVFNRSRSAPSCLLCR